MNKTLHLNILIAFVCFTMAALFPFASVNAQSPTQSQSQDTKILDVQQIKTDSGLTAWLIEDQSLPIITMHFAFKDVGAKLDGANKQGLSQLASNTFDEGAGDIESEEFQKTLQDKAITLRFSASRDDFGGTLKTLLKNKDTAANLLKLALTQPRFDEAPVRRMIESNKARIRRSLSNPDWIAARILNDRIYAAHPYALNTGGTLESLDALTPNDLGNFAATRLAREVLVIGITGAINQDEAAAMIDNVFGGLPATLADALKSARDAVPAQALKPQNKTAVYNKDIPQSVLIAALPALDRNNKDYAAFQVMNYIFGGGGFGSRLMETLREQRGLTYGAYSYPSLLDHAPSLMISTSTENKNAGEVERLIRAEMKTMTDTPVTPENLQAAKSYLIGSLPLSLTSTDKVAAMLSGLMKDDLPPTYLEARQKAIAAVSIADVQRLAQQILKQDLLSLVVVGQPEGLQGFETLKTIPNAE